MSHNQDDVDTKQIDEKITENDCADKPEIFSVARIRLLFCAEDPVAFTARVKNAVLARAKTEGLLRYNLYVDCMPAVGIEKLDSASFSRIMRFVTTTPCPYLKHIRYHTIECINKINNKTHKREKLPIL